MRGSYLADDVPPQPDECTCESQPRHIHHPWGWEGSVGPFPAQYSEPHVYARDVHSGAGNCVCGHPLGDSRHVQAAPGVPIPDRMRP